MDGNVQLLVFLLDEHQYGLRLAQVERVIHAIDCLPLPQAPDIVLGVIDLQGRVLPVLNIRKRFGLPERDISPQDRFIIAQTSGRAVALFVDDVKEVVQRPAQNIVATEQIVQGLEHVAGVIQLEDGLLLIHDLDRFLSMDESKELERALVRQPTHAP